MKQKYPFSKYAVLAELAIADTQFARGNYNEAIDAYKAFARLHPTHEKVEDGYAAYKIGECYCRTCPSDWVLVPPAYEKDQSAVSDAQRELTDFIESTPTRSTSRVKKLHREVMGRLVDHEVYVARFYLDRGHPKAAILRIEAALRALSRVGARGRAAAGARADPPRDGQCPAGAADLPARDQGVQAQSSQAKRAQLFLEFIKRQHGDNPRDADAQATAPRCAMDERTRRLLERGREHYAAGEYDKAEPAAWWRCCATDTPTPTSTTCWGSSTRTRASGKRAQHVRGSAAAEPRPTRRPRSTWR